MSIERCRAGKHKLEIVYEADTCGTGMSIEVVRWCTVCGSVVVDLDYDGRTNAGRVMKMRSPDIAKE